MIEILIWPLAFVNRSTSCNWSVKGEGYTAAKWLGRIKPFLRRLLLNQIYCNHISPEKNGS